MRFHCIQLAISHSHLAGLGNLAEASGADGASKLIYKVRIYLIDHSHSHLGPSNRMLD